MAYEKGHIRTDRGEFLDKGNWGVDPRHPDFGGGADPDGLRDARAAFADADAFAQEGGRGLIVGVGTYRFGSDLTIASPCRLEAGAVLKPDNGVTVTLSGAVMATTADSFDTSAGGTILKTGGDLTIDSTAAGRIGLDDDSNTTVKTSGGDVGVTVTSAGAKASVLDQWGAFANLRAYGGVGDGVTADDDALDAAYAALPAYGGTILFPQGRWLLEREHVFAKPIVLLGSGPRHGEQWATDSDEHGSFVVVGADIAGAVFRWAVSAAGNVVRGSGVRQLSILGASRTYSVDAALHVESADQFVLRDVDIEHVKGSALRVTRCVKGQFSCSDVFNCGDTSKPSVRLDPTGAGLVQGCVFDGFKVEVSHSADYLSIGANVYNCKFIGFGFEDSELDDETAQTFAAVGGVRNQVVGWHFNRQSVDAPTAKLVLSGTYCQLDNLMVAGHCSSTAGNLVVSGNYNTIGSITADGGTNGQPESTTDFLTVTGTGNHIGSVTGLRVGRVVISGDYNQLDSLSSTTAAMQSLLVSGDYCYVGDAMVAFSTYTGAAIEISGTYSRVRARVLQCTAITTEAVLVSGASSSLLPGSHVRNCTSAHGCRVTAAGGEICGTFEVVGGHGVFVDGGDPRLIDVRVIQFGALAASTYDGVSMQSATNKNTGGDLRAFVAQAGGNTARNSVFVTDNAGTPRYNNWIMHITAPGLTASVSAGNNLITKVGS